MSEVSDKIVKLKGKIMKPIADAAGDRRSEAKAKLEAETGTAPEEADIDVVEHETREQHGDISPHTQRSDEASG